MEVVLSWLVVDAQWGGNWLNCGDFENWLTHRRRECVRIDTEKKRFRLPHWCRWCHLRCRWPGTVSFQIRSVQQPAAWRHTCPCVGEARPVLLGGLLELQGDVGESRACHGWHQDLWSGWDAVKDGNGSNISFWWKSSNCECHAGV